MVLGRRLDVPVSDVSHIRGMWEVRVKKYRHRQQKEQERIEQSALPKIDQQWQYRIYCKTMKAKELNLRIITCERSTLTDIQPCTGCCCLLCICQKREQQDQKDPDQSKLSFQLDGDQWTEFPQGAAVDAYLKEWHVSGTKISRLPEYLALFTQLTVLDIPKNNISELPPEIGEDETPDLQHRNHNACTELPFELSSLKQLVHLDIAENRFISIPVCALRMSSLQLLDLSNNSPDGPAQDMDRLEQLATLFLHKNNMNYLPHCLTNISTLKMIVVSGDDITCCPTKLCRNPEIKFIRLRDNRASAEKKKKKEEEKKNKRRRWKQQREEEEEVKKDSREKEFMEAYISLLKDRDTIPESTTKVSISCLL
ncbi:LOW QUALITY PROTEIN: leucine-rich repeat-containing protein 2 [Sebastes umbrosus]|uniref:LOW QUALITY PROTEIN: leucine-rich repeat-containing protein 2 n=1 Tax=Sebastes umbrosus TaxID=72105 RepID=UPI00189D509C|nr:LOW QUALITY PROTEIN: leucine-rich repeat-containing protein 2 [Sebastes umbrosus]